MVNILYVPKAKLTAVGPQLFPFIDRALQYGQGEYTLDNILDAILDDRMQLWGVVDDERGIIGAVTTRIIETPQLRILHIDHLGGEDFASWGEALDKEMTVFARKNNCAMLQALGRPGWVRAIPWAGVEQQYVVIGKRIDG